MVGDGALLPVGTLTGVPRSTAIGLLTGEAVCPPAGVAQAAGVADEGDASWAAVKPMTPNPRRMRMRTMESWRIMTRFLQEQWVDGAGMACPIRMRGDPRC